MTVLYLFRHGETYWNVEQRMQGRGDSPLTERGRAQAAGHGDLLARLGGVDELLVSPSGRTRETAAIVTARLASAGLAAPVSYHDALMERHSGEWEGLTLSEIQARYPEYWQERSTDPWLHRPPGGENHQDMEQRVGDLLDSLRVRMGARGGSAGTAAESAGASALPARVAVPRIGVITHGIMSRVILKSLLELPSEFAVTVRHPNALFYRIELDGKAIRQEYFMDGAGPFPGLFHN